MPRPMPYTTKCLSAQPPGKSEIAAAHCASLVMTPVFRVRFAFNGAAECQ